VRALAVPVLLGRLPVLPEGNVKDARLRARLRKYGLTPAQYVAFCRMKKGCWICGKTKRKDGKPLVLNIDHDHVTGRVRGRLCFRDNKYFIGRRRDSRMYKAAVDYLDSTFDARKIAA
jgi:hypothetical protein